MLKRTMMVFIVLLGITLVLSSIGYSWITEEKLWEIDERIAETEKNLLKLDRSQLLSRIEWANWGIDILTKDIKEMEVEIGRERESWKVLRESYNSEKAWVEWKKVGRKLDRLEWEKQRLHRVLERLKKLRYRLGMRLREATYEPGPLQLGVGLGYLDFTPVSEIRLKINDNIIIFYGSDYEREERDRVDPYFGGEILLAKVPLTGPASLRIPVGIGFVWDENFDLSAGVIGGVMIECDWRNVGGGITKGFVQLRFGFGGNTVILLIGVLL